MEKSKNIALIISVVIFALVLSYVYATWQEPSSAPPEGNVTSTWSSCTGGICYGGGNIGIGATEPGEKLEVSGNIKLSGDSPTYRITNLASPTSNSDAATKGYVDAAVSQGQCDSGLLQIKFTNNSYNGNLGGVSGANTKCNNEYQGYTMCDFYVLKDKGLIGCLPVIGAYMLNQGTAWIGGGSNCSSWSSSSSSLYGTYIRQYNGTWDTTQNDNCAVLKRIACCK